MRFKSVVAAVLFLFLPLTACQADTKSDSKYTEGTDYRTIDPPLAVDATAGKVQVLEFFWYECPHCFDLEPKLQAWLKSKPAANLEFVRVPSVYTRDDGRGQLTAPYIQAKAFYAAEALGVGEKMHTAMFSAIHRDRRSLKTEAEIVKLFGEQGVAANDFLAAYNSFTVETKVARAMELRTRSGIEGVPALIVAGKYHTLGKRATTYEEYLEVTKYLIKRAAGSK